jgi:hypothetical protein
MAKRSHLRLVKSGPAPRLNTSKPIDLTLRCGAALILIGLMFLCVLMAVQLALDSVARWAFSPNA